MKVLLISNDRKILEDVSAVRTRMIEYGGKIEELHIIVFTRKTKDESRNIEISKNVFVYPTHSWSRWVFVFDAIRLGKKIISDNKFVRGDSVITCQDPFECGYVGWRIAQKFRLPLHLQVHTDFLSPYFKTTFFQKFRVWWGKFLLPRAQGVRVVSARIAESIEHAHITLQSRVQILPIRIDVESLEIAPKIDLHSQFPHFKFIILMASRLTREKRIGDALKAFQKLHKKYSFAGLLIAGEGPERKRLEDISKELCIDKNVIFLGYRNDVSSLMKASNVFLTTSEFEGYGMSVIEAGISNCPVISTDVGIAGHILKNEINSFVCHVGDIECFYNSLHKIMTDNALRSIFTGRLQSDIRASIPNKEAYISEWVKGLKDITQKK